MPPTRQKPASRSRRTRSGTGYATALHETGVDCKTARTLLGRAQLSTAMDDICTDGLDNTIDEAAAKIEGEF